MRIKYNLTALSLFALFFLSSCEVEPTIINDNQTDNQDTHPQTTTNINNEPQSTNTNTNTETLSIVDEPNDSDEPLSALAIIDQHCSNCHQGNHDAWQNKANNQWIEMQGNNEALINTTDPLNSLLLRRIKFYMGESSNMPPANSNSERPFTLEHFQTLQQWTQQISAQYIGLTTGAVSISASTFNESELSINYECIEQDTYTISILNADDLSTALIENQILNCAEETINFNNQWNTQRIRVDIKTESSLASSQFIDIIFSSAASCNVQQQLLPPKIRRLSQSQLKNSLIGIFGDIYSHDTFIDLEDGAKLIGMNDTAAKLSIDNLNFERIFQISTAVTEQILTNHSEFNACSNLDTSECVTSLKQQYAPLMWRRPLLTQENESLDTAIDSLPDNQARLEFLIQSLTLSSNFLFRSEIGTKQNDISNLTNYEIVSLVSFAILNRSPDQTLLTLAAQPSQLSPTVLAEHIQNLMNQEDFEHAMMQMYQDFLKLELVLSRPKDESFDFNDTVRSDILLSAQLSLLNNINTQAGITDVLAGDQFYINEHTDYLFGLESNDSELTLSSNILEREGLLNHPAFLSVHSTLAKSGIVKRGVFTLEQLLCQSIPEPPASVEPIDPPADIIPEQTSERELLQITHSSQAGCNGCHESIDPAGFGLENFDSIGRYRETEKQNVVIDASGALDILKMDGTIESLTFNHSKDFSQTLLASSQLQSCISHRFLEHFLGDDLNYNDCEAQKFRQALSTSDNQLADLIAQLIQLESLYLRSDQ